MPTRVRGLKSTRYSRVGYNPQKTPTKLSKEQRYFLFLVLIASVCYVIHSIFSLQEDIIFLRKEIKSFGGNVSSNRSGESNIYNGIQNGTKNSENNAADSVPTTEDSIFQDFNNSIVEITTPEEIEFDMFANEAPMAAPSPVIPPKNITKITVKNATAKISDSTKIYSEKKLATDSKTNSTKPTNMNKTALSNNTNTTPKTIFYTLNNTDISRRINTTTAFKNQETSTADIAKPKLLDAQNSAVTSTPKIETIENITLLTSAEVPNKAKESTKSIINIIPEVISMPANATNETVGKSDTKNNHNSSIIPVDNLNTNEFGNDTNKVVDNSTKNILTSSITLKDAKTTTTNSVNDTNTLINNASAKDAHISNVIPEENKTSNSASNTNKIVKDVQINDTIVSDQDQKNTTNSTNRIGGKSDNSTKIFQDVNKMKNIDVFPDKEIATTKSANESNITANQSDLSTKNVQTDSKTADDKEIKNSTNATKEIEDKADKFAKNLQINNISVIPEAKNKTETIPEIVKLNENGNIIANTTILTTTTPAATTTTTAVSAPNITSDTNRDSATKINSTQNSSGIVNASSHVPNTIPSIIANQLRKVSNAISINGPPESETMINSQNNSDNVCHIPKLQPHDPSILHFVKEPKNFNCTGGYPLLFYTDLESNLILNASLEKNGFAFCCYTKMISWKKDTTERFSDSCAVIQKNITKIPKTMDVIAIFCRNKTSNETKMVDIFGFIHMKPNVEERIEAFTGSSTENKDNVNVIILGMDSLSHMNFIRTMPKTHYFLTNKLSAIFMNGYSKIGDNTLPNLLPVHTGLTINEAEATCGGKKRHFDDCPFIWKDYAASGYRTVYFEDAPPMSTFNYLNRGFKKPPTDYYGRPLVVALEALQNRRSMNVHLCHGPRPAFDLNLDYLKKAIHAFGYDKKYFYYMWSSLLSHDYLNNPKIGDDLFFRTLEWLSEGNYLNNTILLMMSDHGMRWGGIRKTYQGIIEERMPVLYTVLPKWFSEKYKTAIDNFKSNSEKLTTHFDLHETLKDFLNLENLEDDKIKIRSKILKSGMKVPRLNSSALGPRGISLFLPIPPTRDCQQADIPDHFCICHELQSISVENNTIQTSLAGQAVVNTINQIISKYPQCTPLKLKKVTDAQKWSSFTKEVKDSERNSMYHIIISIVTSPGDGNFEATAVRNKTGNNWVVTPDISRTNLYANQSHCVKDSMLKKYCFCK